MSELHALEQHRQLANAQIQALSVDEEADPLAVYDDLIQWTLKNYHDHTQSGLIEQLEECLMKFKEDPRYTGAEFRYVSLWIHFANRVEKPSAVFAYMMDKGIGKLYSIFFEGYAESLEREGRYSEAETILGIGIRTQAKPLKHLQKYQAEYITRRAVNRLLPAKDSLFKEPCNASLRAILADPLRRILSKLSDIKTASHAIPQDVTMTTTHNQPATTKQNPYAHLNAPPAANKRPEKLMFDLTLLLEPDGTEYCFEEARARHLGLLGKKWPSAPPPKGASSSDLAVTSNGRKERSVKVDFNDQGTKTSRLARRQSVTINTKQALEDVLDMYNEVDDAEPVSMVQTPSNSRTSASRQLMIQDENALSMGSKPPAFQPIIDQKRENVTPAAPKFRTAAIKTPVNTFTPNESRKALVSKETVTPVPVFKVARPQDKLVTPALRELKPFVEETNLDVIGGDDVTTNMTEEFTNVSLPPPPPRSFVPFVDNEENRPFTVHKDESVFSVPRDENVPPPPKIPKFQVHRDENKRPLSPPVFRPQRQEEHFIEPEWALEEKCQMVEDRRPVMTRFGNFDVMTPITERTCELTMSTRAADTSETSIMSDKGRLALHARDTAEQLAAELREEEGWEREMRRNADVFLDKSGFKIPNPCNPSDPVIVSKILSLLETDESHRDLKHLTASHLHGLQRFATKRVKPRGSGGSTGQDESLFLNLDGDEYQILDKLGEGGFGAVFMARDLRHSRKRRVDDDEDDFDDDAEEAENDLVAIKAVRPTNLWESCVLRRILSAVPSSLCRSIVVPQTLYAYQDESFLVLSLCRQGTLLDIVNRASEIGIGPPSSSGLDELLVMFFTIELLRLLEGLHTAGFIHGDLKIDNCLIRLEDVHPANAWSSEYSLDGSGGWSSKGLTLIDFGRTIDTRLYPAGQTFISDWKTDARDCAEMRAGRSWTFQTDYAGLASIVYCMLFGQYIDTVEVELEDGSRKVRSVQAMKRYWQTALWNRLFDVLLNPGHVAGGMGGVRNELGRMRQELGEYVRVNCNRGGKNLKGMLKKIELASLSRW